MATIKTMIDSYDQLVQINDQGSASIQTTLTDLQSQKEQLEIVVLDACKSTLYTTLESKLNEFTEDLPNTDGFTGDGSWGEYATVDDLMASILDFSGSIPVQFLSYFDDDLGTGDGGNDPRIYTFGEYGNSNISDWKIQQWQWLESVNDWANRLWSTQPENTQRLGEYIDVYVFNDTGWDSDTTIFTCIRDYEFTWDLIYHDPADGGGTYGINKMIEIYTQAKDAYESNSEKYISAKDILNKYV